MQNCLAFDFEMWFKGIMKTVRTTITLEADIWTRLNARNKKRTKLTYVVDRALREFAERQDRLPKEQRII